MPFTLDEIFDKVSILECDGGGCACGGDCGGGCGDGGGTATGDVLGPDGSAEGGSGCMGPGDFHVPFPAMPCLFRWPANCVGGSQKKRKKGKKTVSAKNPYVKGMKTIVAEDDENVVKYVGQAKEEFDKIVGPAGCAYTGVLNYNDQYRLAWMIRDDGVLHFYKPMDAGSYWTVYATHLDEDGSVVFDYKAGRYPTEQAALDAVYRAAKEHEKKLRECLEKLDEARPDMRRFMNLTARGVDPIRAWREASAEPYVDARRLADEAKRRFPHQFDELRLDNGAGRWTAEFRLPLPDGQAELRGQQRVATAIPQINQIMSFLRTRGVYVNSYDVTARA